MKSKNEIIQEVSNITKFSTNQISNVLKLVEQNCTIHFIARYRKEMTGNLDGDSIRLIINENKKIMHLDKIKESAIKSIREQNKLTPKIKKLIENANTLQEVEDIYAPFKRKRKTKADIARQKGFDIIANQIKKQIPFNIPLDLSNKYPKKEIIQGAIDIVAQDIADDSKLKDLVRKYYKNNAIISSTIKDENKFDDKQLKEAHKFKIYHSFNYSIKKIKNYQILALNRGESLNILKIDIVKDENFFKTFSHKIKIKKNNSNELDKAIKSGYDKIFSSIKNEIRSNLTELASKSAIKVFQDNLKKLLMLKPHNVKTILAIDPGFRTGCKICVLENSLPKEFSKIYLDKKNNSIKTISDILSKYYVDSIIIGNGTASDETFELINDNFKEYKDKIVMVNETGASVYSVSKVSKEEFPNLDSTDRGTISIGRRYLDSLSELVKIPVISIGVGMYQHDINQKILEQKLSECVEDVVNLVGINVNTASPYLLNYVSGINKRLAKKIFDNRPYKSRLELKKIMSAKAYEQCIGFLRVINDDEPFDNSAIHPNQYEIAKLIIKNYKKGLKINEIYTHHKSKLISLYPNLNLNTIKDIIKYYLQIGQELRVYEGNLKKTKIIKMEDLKKNDILQGVVRNIMPFGVFVDIGLKNSGFIHISNISNDFVKDPNDYLNIGQEIKTKIINIDINKEKIELSLKDI